MTPASFQLPLVGVGVEGPQHQRLVLCQVDLLVDHRLRPGVHESRLLVLVVGEIHGVSEARDGGVGRSDHGGGPGVDEGLERGVGTCLGDPGARPGERHADDAVPVDARVARRRRGDQQRAAGTGEVASGQAVAVQRIVGDGGRSLGDGLGSQDEHLGVEILGGVQSAPTRLRHRDTGLGLVDLRLHQRVPDGCDHGRDRDREDHGAVAAHGPEHGRVEPVRLGAGILHQLTFAFPHIRFAHRTLKLLST